jgi:hypothetical protein
MTAGNTTHKTKKIISKIKRATRQKIPTNITISLINIPTNLIIVLTTIVPKNSPGSNCFVYELSKRRQGEKKVLSKRGMEKNL